MSEHSIQINRAPVLTLWAAQKAELDALHVDGGTEVEGAGG
ncbi:MAG TPA: hypothetical protein VNO32_11315 [Candidatus Acidoferrum sp.]|nr:hypothetical protein [Candidatus Acidoferrum sp.]